MSKKKPYSRVETGKTLRKLNTALARDTKKLTAIGAPEWFIRIVAELTSITELIVKLRDFLYVKETADSEAALSDEANAVCPKALKLLIKQEKAMTAYGKVLEERIKLGYPKTEGVCECKKVAKKTAAKKAK